MSSSGYINVFQWNGERFFSRREKLDSGFNVMAVYEASRHGPKSRLLLHWQPEVSHEFVEKTLLILQESQRDPLLDLDAAVSRWMFSVPALVFFGLLPALTVRFRDASRSDHRSIRVRSYHDQLHGPIRFPQQLFSVHDHGRQRSDRGPQHLPCPYVGLTVH